MNNLKTLVFALVVFACIKYACAGEVKVPITADNSICAYSSETKSNLGTSPRIKMKGIQNFLIFDFDTLPLKNMIVKRAVLHIKGTEKNIMVRKVGFSTIAVAWNEGTSSSDAKPGAKGDSCFESPDFGSDKKWGGPSSNFLNAYGGRSGTIWTQSYVTHNDDVWFDMEFDGRLMEACAAGLSHGICCSDDNGQTGNGHKDVVPDTNNGNNYFFSREQNNAMPYFVVEVEPAPDVATAALTVAVKPWQSGADLSTGGLEISWPGPANADEAKSILGYVIRASVGGTPMAEIPRFKVPSPGKPGEPVRALLRHQPVDAETEVEVTIITRGGKIAAKGSGKGKVSAAYPKPAQLPLETFNAVLNPGKPPENDSGIVWVVPDCAKVNPITNNVYEESADAYAKDPAGTWSQANAAWSGATKTVSLHSLRGEWAAFQLVCQNKKDGTAWTVKPGDLKGPDGGVIPAASVRLSLLWYQKAGKDEKGWYPDPLLPLKAGDAFTIPNEKNAVPGQKNQTVYVDFFVPKDAKPGTYSGTISVQAANADPVELPISLAVGNAVIPDEAHFVWSMNAYSSPGNEFGKEDSAEFLQAERSFYTVAHEHRTNLAILHYGHSAHFEAGTHWPLAGKGKDMKVISWEAWDKRFGPLFDGSAFKDTPRAGVGVDHFYLPLAEHYPTPMTDYKWNDAKWEEHWKVAGPIDEGFSQDYKDQWTAVAREFDQHVKEKGWKTKFQIYLNDKYYYKQYKPKTGAGKGVSFWLLDEPNHIDDYHALAFFSKLLRAAQNGDRSRVLFRADISRPESGRDTLDGLIDVNVSGGFGGYRSWLEDWRERYHQDIWTYGGAERTTSSALDACARALDLYTSGVSGFVPWLTLGNSGNWTKYEDTCVIYSGKQFGITGACPSLRLKAYRRAEQDVEYLYLLAEKRNLLKDDPARRQLEQLAESAVKVTRTFGKLDAEGAVTESFSGLRIDDFERLRKAITAELK